MSIFPSVPSANASGAMTSPTAGTGATGTGTAGPATASETASFGEAMENQAVKQITDDIVHETLNDPIMDMFEEKAVSDATAKAEEAAAKISDGLSG